MDMTDFFFGVFIGILLCVVLITPIIVGISDTNRTLDCVKNTSLNIELCESIVKNRYEEGR